MKYKLINKQTGEEHICEKVTIDGMDYYVSDEIIKDVRPYKGKWQIEEGTILNKFPTYLTDLSSCRLVIATTNPNIDIPKVVDEVEELFPTNRKGAMWMPNRDEINNQYKQEGYNKSQETHPFSEEDVIEFLNWVGKDGYPCIDRTKKGLWVLHPQEPKDFTPKELLQLWKEQQPKIVCYE